MGKLLDSVNSPKDIKKLDLNKLNILSKEVRDFLIESVSKTGGHLASNLGVVELTLALHTVFSTPYDKIIWDVGHQTYVHKILTGRKQYFSSLRQFGGISGFPKTNESEHDIFNTGHSSTSISAALGMAKARDINQENHSVVAVIGDGALTGGMSFEALNDAGRSHNNLIVILNDNEMSITKNVGALSKYLNRIRTQPVYFKVKEDIDSILNKIPAIGKGVAKLVHKAKGSIKHLVIPGTLFEELGFTYIGPVDGHDIEGLTRVLKRAKSMKGPIFIHVYTTKGRGYSFAEEEPHTFHGVSCFDTETGEVSGSKNQCTYSDVFGKCLTELALQDKSIVAVTAAMCEGTGLGEFCSKFPERFFDVGIAEQHAVTFSAGLAVAGMKPIIAVYSSFLQRAYDQIIHDVAMQNLHVIFCIDRAGIVGQDGETHQGIFDISYLNHIPNMTIFAPASFNEFHLMIKYAVMEHKGTIAIRYPRGKEEKMPLIGNEPITLGKGIVCRQGMEITIVAVGKMVGIALKAAERLEALNIDAEVINARSIKPLDTELIIKSAKKTSRVLTLEDNVVEGGFGSRVLGLFGHSNNIKVKVKGFPDEFIPHGSIDELFYKYKMDVDGVVGEVQDMLKK